MAKEEEIEVHVKISKSDHAFLLKFKKEFGVSVQEFMNKATIEKIIKLKNT